MINSIIRSTSAASGQSPTLIGITNDVNLKDSFPTHLQSVLCENQIFINPYDAEQLEDILRARIAEAFRPGSVTDEAIGLCAAYSAQDHGDARKAIELIRIAGEIVTIVGRHIVDEADVIEANVKINVYRVVKVLEPLPTQTKAVLLASIYTSNSLKKNSTNNIHAVYTEIVNAVGMEAVAPRRMRDILTELDQLGVIDVENVNKGRKGRKKLVTAINSKEALVGVLLADYKRSAIAYDDPSVFIRKI
jgi:cell division control protein 6